MFLCKLSLACTAGSNSISSPSNAYYIYYNITVYLGISSWTDFTRVFANREATTAPIDDVRWLCTCCQRLSGWCHSLLNTYQNCILQYYVPPHSTSGVYCIPDHKSTTTTVPDSVPSGSSTFTIFLSGKILAMLNDPGDRSDKHHFFLICSAVRNWYVQFTRTAVFSSEQQEPGKQYILFIYLFIFIFFNIKPLAQLHMGFLLRTAICSHSPSQFFSVHLQTTHPPLLGLLTLHTPLFFSFPPILRHLLLFVWVFHLFATVFFYQGLWWFFYKSWIR